MRGWRGWWLRLVRQVRWHRAEQDIDEELRFHLDMEAERLRSEGLDAAEARRRARMAFGGEDRWREEVRAARGTAWLEDTWRDLRRALRGLRRAPGFAAAAVGTLGLGIGATTAVFSVVEQVVLSPLPYPDGDELVAVWSRDPARGIARGTTSWPNFSDWREGAATLDGMAAVVPDRVALTGAGEPEEIRAAAVSRGFFELVGIRMALGRGFHDGEVEGDAAGAVVLGHDLFVRRFGADPAVVGRTVRIDDAAYEVVGVAAAGAAWPRDVELWTPLAFGTGRQWRDPRQRNWLTVVGRLADGQTLDAARREMDGIAARLASAYPETNRGVGVAVESLRDTVVGEARAPLLVLLGAVALVLLMAVVNVATLQLARGAARSREMAARRALGAGRGRIVRQALADGVVLALAGGLLGALLAGWSVAALVAAAPPGVPRLDEVAVDGGVLAVAMAAALASSLVFGLAPALRAGRIDPGASLRGAPRGAGAGDLGRMRGLFVGGQFAVAFVLLVGAALLLRSFMALRVVDPGFDAEGALTVSLPRAFERYPDPDAWRGFQDALLTDLAALPHVEAVGAVAGFFIDDLRAWGTVAVEGRPDRWDADEAVPVVGDAASPGFFRAMGLDVLQGRAFDTSDGAEDPSVAVVSETFARRLLDGAEPVGQRFTWGRPYGEDTRWFTVVGVVEDALRSGLDAAPRPAVYVPMAQSSSSAVDIVVRTAGDPADLVAAVRGAVAALDPDLPVTRVRTLEQAMMESLAQRRFVTLLLAAFAATALVLAAVGVFGVTAYVVGRRTREIGIRMALGAAEGRVLAGVVREGLVQAGAGLAAGGLVAFALTGVVRGQLVDLAPTDPLTWAASAAALLAVAALASVVPARRAARVEAAVALRTE